MSVIRKKELWGRRFYDHGTLERSCKMECRSILHNPLNFTCNYDACYIKLLATSSKNLSKQRILVNWNAVHAFLLFQTVSFLSAIPFSTSTFPPPFLVIYRLSWTMTPLDYYFYMYWGTQISYHSLFQWWCSSPKPPVCPQTCAENNSFSTSMCTTCMEGKFSNTVASRYLLRS